MKYLTKKDYYKLIEPIKLVSINNLFARSIIEGKVDGEIYVDNEENPNTFYILHPYGMSLLFGDYENDNFNLWLKKRVLNTDYHRKKDEWVQVFPHHWDKVVENLLEEDNSDKIESHTRVNFKFNQAKYLQNKKSDNENDTHILIKLMDKDIFEKMTGTVVPLNFWNNAEDFVNNGVAFSLFYDNNLASTAFSAFIHDNKLELGIETYEEFKGKGLAYKACSALIDYCLINNYEPVWSCRLSNIGSYKLAEKLGFINSKEISFYKLRA